MLKPYILIYLNGKPYNCSLDLFLLDLLVYLDINLNSNIIEYNSEIIQNVSLKKIILQEGDRVEIVTMVGGG